MVGTSNLGTSNMASDLAITWVPIPLSPWQLRHAPGQATTDRNHGDATAINFNDKCGCNCMIYGLSCRATGLSGFWIVFTSVIAGYVELHVQQALRHRACPIPSYPEPRLCLLISDCLEDFMASQVANHFFSMSGGKSAVSGQVHILVENSRDISPINHSYWQLLDL
jgi:hypothetical protein